MSEGKMRCSVHVGQSWDGHPEFCGRERPCYVHEPKELPRYKRQPQVKKPMTVGELRAELNKYPAYDKVYVKVRGEEGDAAVAAVQPFEEEDVYLELYDG